MIFAFDSMVSATFKLRLAVICRPKSSGWISYSRISPLTNSPTSVPAPSDTSSILSRPYTTMACCAPRRCNTRTWMPTKSAWNTPIKIFGAPAGLVSGPRILKIERTPNSRRTGATCFIAAWWLGANMKPMPVCAIDCAICSGFKLMLAPSDSMTSALPDEEDTLRPPCLATRAPAAAATNIEAVEILNVCAPSPPVPTMSSSLRVSAIGTLVENSRITCAAAAISPMVSFLTRRPMVSAATITGDISPDMIWRNRCSISSWKISRCSIQRSRASWWVIGMAVPSQWGRGTDRWRARGRSADRSANQEVFQQRVAVLGQDGFGVELHALDVVFLVAHAHDFAIVGPCRHFEAGRQRAAFNGQRVIADHGERRRQILEDADAGVRDDGSFAMHDLLGADDFSAERFADGLVAEADAEYRLLAGEVLQHG